MVTQHRWYNRFCNAWTLTSLRHWRSFCMAIFPTRNRRHLEPTAVRCWQLLYRNLADYLNFDFAVSTQEAPGRLLPGGGCHVNLLNALRFVPELAGKNLRQTQKLPKACASNTLWTPVPQPRSDRRSRSSQSFQCMKVLFSGFSRWDIAASACAGRCGAHVHTER